MYQNIKNFSDLLDIDRFFLSIDLCLAPVIQGRPPVCKVTINDVLQFQGRLLQTIQLHQDIDLLTPVDLKVTLQDKLYSHTQESAIIVKSLAVDGFDLIPNYVHCVKYINDHEYDQPTNYIGFNGTWHFSTQLPFYQWRHHAQSHGWLLTPNAPTT